MKRLVGALIVFVGMAGCASSEGGAGAASGAAMAPPPAKAVAVDSFYTGVWHEIARNPMKITDGCVAGETRFYKDETGQLIDRDSCRKGTPAGEEKVFAGPVTILDPGFNAKFRTAYRVFGVFTVKRDYWILDHGADWFIVATPKFKDLSLFTRSPKPDKALVDQLVSRAQALGYNTASLEFPAQP